MTTVRVPSVDLVLKFLHECSKTQNKESLDGLMSNLRTIFALLGETFPQAKLFGMFNKRIK